MIKRRITVIKSTLVYEYIHAIKNDFTSNIWLNVKTSRNGSTMISRAFREWKHLQEVNIYNSGDPLKQDDWLKFILAQIINARNYSPRILIGWDSNLNLESGKKLFARPISIDNVRTFHACIADYD